MKVRKKINLVSTELFSHLFQQTLSRCRPLQLAQSIMFKFTKSLFSLTFARKDLFHQITAEWER